MKAFKSVASLSLIAILLSGCATSNAAYKYILPSKKDVLTKGTKQQIIEHNEFCEKQGNCTRPE